MPVFPAAAASQPPPSSQTPWVTVGNFTAQRSFVQFCHQAGEFKDFGVCLLFRSLYPESHRILLEDPDLGSCANCCFQVYVHFYGKEFLAFFHHIFQEVYDSRHMPRPDAACPLTRHLFPLHICPSGQGQCSQKSTIQIGQTPLF